MFIEDSFWHLFADKDMIWLSGKNFGTFFHSELQVKVVCVGNSVIIMFAHLMKIYIVVHH